MKTIQLFAGVAVLFCALSFTSCGKEENLPPITCYFDYDVNEEDPIEHVGLV